jgi:hypothetical protein
MTVEGASLWGESAAWRWLVAGSLLCLGLGLAGSPWRGAAPSAGVAAASYRPAAPAAPQAVQHTVPAAPRGVAATAAPAGIGSGQADRMDASGGAPAATPAQGAATAHGGAARPHTPSSVVWASSGGMMPGSTISGGGLIASYCCAGAMSTAWASRGVVSGRHYWELTLTTQPGEQTAGTWTEAGIAPRAAVDSGRVKKPSVRGGEELAVRPGRDPSIRNGDVLMFALDADQKLGYWGINGQWRNGTPGSAGGLALALAPGEQFFAFGTLSTRSDKSVPEGDRWIANFGGQKFRYAVPPGYDSYGSSGGGAAAAQLAQVPSPAPAPGPVAPDSMLGKVIQGTATVSGQSVPLPDGKWVVLAHFKGSAAAPGDAVLLGQVTGRDLRRMIAINAARGARPASKGATFRSCLRQDVFHQSNQEGRPDAPQCWWVNHATALWEQQGLFRAAQGELATRGVQTSAVYLNVGFYRSDADGFATAFYYFDPAEEGIASDAVPWAQSEWHKSRIGADPQRSAYAQKLADWGRHWAPVFFATR